MIISKNIVNSLNNITNLLFGFWFGVFVFELFAGLPSSFYKFALILHLLIVLLVAASVLRQLLKNDTIKAPKDDGVSTLSGNGRKRGGGTQPK